MFSIGDQIAHHLHGAGVIDGIEERRINGVTRKYYQFRLPAGGMEVMIPVDHCEEIGIRPIISAEEADELLQELGDIEIDMTQNWNRRYRENMDKLRSGDPCKVAEVIRNLMRVEREKRLSTGEKKLLANARQILTSEIVLVEGIPEEEAMSMIDKAV